MKSSVSHFALPTKLAHWATRKTSVSDKVEQRVLPVPTNGRAAPVVIPPTPPANLAAFRTIPDVYWASPVVRSKICVPEFRCTFRVEETSTDPCVALEAVEASCRP